MPNTVKSVKYARCFAGASITPPLCALAYIHALGKASTLPNEGINIWYHSLFGWFLVFWLGI